jgi:hypothetical protein
LHYIDFIQQVTFKLLPFNIIFLLQVDKFGACAL